MFCSVYSVSLCCSVYCLCVHVYCTAPTGIHISNSVETSDFVTSEVVRKTAPRETGCENGRRLNATGSGSCLLLGFLILVLKFGV